jgi:hypothetical protein
MEQVKRTPALFEDGRSVKCKTAFQPDPDDFPNGDLWSYLRLFSEH